MQLLFFRDCLNLSKRSLVRKIRCDSLNGKIRQHFNTTAAEECQRNEFSLVSPQQPQQPDMTIFSLAGLIVATTASLVWYHAQSTKCQEGDDEGDKSENMFQLEVDLMDKIAKRPYLHPFDSLGSQYITGDDENDQYSFPVDKDCSIPRPPGVPYKLRILALDMPEIKNTFSGAEYMVSKDHEYPTGIAPPKRCFATAKVWTATDLSGGDQVDLPNPTLDDDAAEIPEEAPHEQDETQQPDILATSATLEDSDPSAVTIIVPPLLQAAKLLRVHYRVEQKTVAQTLLQWTNPKTEQVSVQVLMGNISQLNPNRIHPSKRRRSNVSQNHDGDDQQEDNNDPSILSDPYRNVVKVYAQIKDELEAPWHQYAWMDELKLRIGGRVRFGDCMRRTSPFSRIIWQDNVYQQSVPSSQTVLDWFLVPPLQTDSAGMDGKDLDCDGVDQSNWASQKPHAVIANGAVLRQVPGSMLFLRHLCQQEQVPLLIYQDSKSWRGCRSYDDINELLYDLRQTVQQHVVRKALRCHQHDLTFASGRLFGQVETETKNILNESVRGFVTLLQRHLLASVESDMDWSRLDVSQLEAKLRERKVIQVDKVRKLYSPSMVELSRQCISERTPADRSIR